MPQPDGYARHLATMTHSGVLAQAIRQHLSYARTGLTRLALLTYQAQDAVDDALKMTLDAESAMRSAAEQIAAEQAAAE